MAKRRKSTKGKPRSKYRASWRGQLRFGLVSFEVQAVNAQIKEQSEIHFHLLHEPDHQRIHYAKVCPKHGEVSNDEIVEATNMPKASTSSSTRTSSISCERNGSGPSILMPS